MRGQRAVVVLSWLGIVSGLAGVAFYSWARNREYADLQRTYGYGAAVVCISGGLIVVTLAVVIALRIRDGDN